MHRAEVARMVRWIVVGILLGFGSSEIRAQSSDAEGIAFFETSIRPLLIERCVECHGSEAQEGELRLDTFSGIVQGGVSGPLFVAAQPEISLLVMAVEHRDPGLEMPPDEKLPETQIALLRKWVEMGLPHPEAADGPGMMKRVQDQSKGREHWAFQPLQSPPLPGVQHDAWVKQPIDRFILSGLQSQGLLPSETADRRTLIRRATLDLHGVPPTAREIQAFVEDPSPSAFEKVIDRLLASQRYGERWGRHWLDVVRYADSNGLDENIAHGNAWRYRDYVIASFNEDLPFDTFIVEQIAGDQLAFSSAEKTKEHQNAIFNPQHHRQLIATGFLSMGPKVLAEVDETKMEMDIVDEQVSTLGTTFLGMTFGCARCHDHKFDPISMRDYYALAGVFQSTKTMDSFTKIAKWHENEIPTFAEIEAKQTHESKLQQLKQEIDNVVTKATESVVASLADGSSAPENIESRYDDETKQLLAGLREQVAALEKSVPAFSSAMGVIDGKVIDVPLHLRGSHLTLGEVVPRGVPEVFPVELRPEFPQDSSGRLQLARWLVSSEVPHPLTSRVLVNRVWRWHFGKGLVASTDNFGILGDQPTHPELLDWLAFRFIQLGWSLKSLHREIMLSSTYQMSATIDENRMAMDPENRWMWRANARRLEAESLRDSLLSVGGLLDSQMGGSMLHVGNRQFLFDHTSKDETKYDHHRRSVYLPVIRNNIYDFFQLFDYADASVPNGNRSTSTVATQSLFMMNGPLVIEASERLAARLMQLDGHNDRLNQLFWEVLGREPTNEEIVKANEFIGDVQGLLVSDHASEGGKEHMVWAALCQAVLASSEFVFIP